MEELKSESVTKIVPSKNYLVGTCSITQIVGKDKKLIFDGGDPIEVNEEELNKIKQLGWCLIVEDE